MVKNPSSNAGDAGSVPDQGTKTPPHTHCACALKVETLMHPLERARAPQ